MEVCRDKFQSFREREQHLTQDHAYPQNYFFAVTKFGINAKRQSMLVEHDREHNSQRKGSRSRGRKSKSHAAKPAAQRGDTTDSREEPMADAEGPVEDYQPVEETQGTAPDVSMGETPWAAGNSGATRDMATASVSNPRVAKPSEQQRQQGSADADTEMDDLAGAMLSLKFVPRAVRLGTKPKPHR